MPSARSATSDPNPAGPPDPRGSGESKETAIEGPREALRLLGLVDQAPAPVRGGRCNDRSLTFVIMARIEVVFSDVGGVLLTNGWDHSQRRRACEHFDLDWEEFEDRHQFVAERFETGRIDLDLYLERTVFYRERPFSLDDFAHTMRAGSGRLDGGIDLARRIAAKGVTMATLNNESRALNEYRISQFALDEIFTAFFSSCYLGVTKPDDQIFRTALAVMAVEPERALFIDDRPINIESAASLGIHTILHVQPASTEDALAELGL
jgi:putative hydrolase of the HAD superfamily